MSVKRCLHTYVTGRVSKPLQMRRNCPLPCSTSYTIERLVVVGTAGNSLEKVRSRRRRPHAGQALRLRTKALADSRRRRTVHDERDDETVQTQNFSEDENKDLRKVD
jgi:hypothetical protein